MVALIMKKHNIIPTKAYYGIDSTDPLYGDKVPIKCRNAFLYAILRKMYLNLTLYTNNATDLYENGIVKYGKFKLKSGQESNYYVDIKSSISKPELFKKITREFSCMIDDIKHHSNLCICGVPHGAVPFASALSYETSIPMIMLRKDVKTHGTRQQIEGEYSKGTCVILIEDVTTTGTSLINAAQALKDNGLNVIKMLCIANEETNRYPSMRVV